MTRNNKSVGVNAVLNAIKSGLSVVFPLITFPYATRVLGVENLGKVNYAQSIEHYFALLAALGISTYAIREGAKIRDKKQEFTQFTSEIFTLNLFTALCSYLLMIAFLAVSVKLRDYRLLILLQSLSILFTTIGVDWLNTIYEDYLLITVRSIVTNLASMALLFLLVKKPEDYYIYAMLTVVTNAIIGISNQYYCRRYTKIHLCLDKKIFRHLKSSIIFFANSLAVSVYVNADTTMLGWISGDYYVGIYSVAVKVYNIIKTMLAALYVVAIPRLSYYIGNDKVDDFKNLFSKLITYLALLLLPCMAGLISLSHEIIIILAGKEYLAGELTLQILSVGLIFAIFGGAITNCLNVPLKRETVNMKATIVSAIINVVLNLLIIPYWRQNGAAVTTVISEFVVFGICVVSYKGWRNILDYKYVVKNFIHAIIGMLSVFLICYIISNIYSENNYIAVALKVVFSLIAYFLELIILRNDCLHDVLSGLKRKLIK